MAGKTKGNRGITKRVRFNEQEAEDVEEILERLRTSFSVLTRELYAGLKRSLDKDNKDKE